MHSARIPNAKTRAAMEEARAMTRRAVNAQPPGKWKVVVYNDDTTPADFLIELFTMTFGLTKIETLKALEIRKYHGDATVMVAPWEVAEQKIVEARREIDARGFLLEIKSYPL